MIRAEEYLSQRELVELGLAGCGRNVFISRKAIIGYPQSLRIGNCVRIDAYCNIIGSAEITLGDHVHVGSAVSINAAAEVRIGNYCGIASGARLFTSDDDYSGEFLTGPTVAPENTRVRTAPIELRGQNVIGANSVVLPGTTLEEGAILGALSLARGTYDCWAIYGGVPACKLKDRSKELLDRVPQA